MMYRKCEKENHVEISHLTCFYRVCVAAEAEQLDPHVVLGGGMLAMLQTS